MFNKIFSGIFGHFLLRTCVIQALSGVLLLIIVLPFFNQSTQDLAVEQGQIFTRSMLAANSDAISAQDFSTVVEHSLNVTKAAPHVLFIAFSNRNGEELIIQGNQWAVKNKTLPFYKLKFHYKNHDVAATDYVISYAGFSVGFADSIQYSQPIYISGKEWGVLTTSFSTEAYSSSIKSFYLIVVAYTLFAILLSLVLFSISSKKIRVQLRSFVRVAEKLAQGQLTFKAQESAIGEIGVLGKAVNTMSSVLAEKSTRLFQLAQIVEQSDDAFILFDETSHIILANDAVLKFTGFAPAHFIGMSMEAFSKRYQLHLAKTLQEFNEALSRGHHIQTSESVIIKPDQQRVDVEIRFESILNNQDHSHYCLVVMTDITSRKAAADEIKSLAFYDTLTKLPNRRLLMDRLHQAVASSDRSHKHGALLFIDLDNFKTLNDTHGHDMGDLLLQQVANRLLSCVREGDTVARLGGDEFVVMLENLNEDARLAVAETELVGDKILTTLNQLYPLAEIQYSSTPSVGITLFDGNKQSVDELLKRADIAMYESKMAGRNTLRFFDPEMQAIINARALLEESIRTAIHESQFVLHYQPQVDCHANLLGVEALVRWQHPQKGLVYPIDFIPLAEESGQILQIGHWVLDTACKQIAVWSKRSETSALTISVNVSIRQIQEEDFVAQVLDILVQTGANPQRLKLELTESVLLHDVETTIAKMTLLKSKGVNFSLDDFGTGYSSLSYLKRLPLDQLKIDKSFVRDVLVDADDAAIARTIVALAKTLSIEVIAEGVETEAQLVFLKSIGCQVFQGYLFGKPVAVDDLQMHRQSALNNAQAMLL